MLLVGRIRELALYRAEVLSGHGFLVSIQTDEAEAEGFIKRGDFDIAVLSYTLSNDAVQHLADLVRGYYPDRPLITISEKRWVDRRIDPDEVVIADEGPAGLLAALRRVSRRG